MNGGSPPPTKARRLFSGRLSPTSFSKRQPVPLKNLADFPDFRGAHAVDLRVRFQTHMYHMVCSIRRTCCYKKPVLSKGWIEFVQQNRLQVSDKVTVSVLDQDGTADDPIHLIEAERALVLNTVGQDAPSLPHNSTIQDCGAVAAAEQLPPTLDGDGIKRLKLHAPVSPSKEVDNTKLLVGPATNLGCLSRGLSAAYGPNINLFWGSTTDQAKGGSADYDKKGIKQRGVAGPSKSPLLPVKLFGVFIYLGDDKVTRGKLELVSSTKEGINQPTGELPADLNSVPAAADGESGDQELDLTLKLGLGI